jgi:hypothetical protein
MVPSGKNSRLIGQARAVSFRQEDEERDQMELFFAFSGERICRDRYGVSLRVERGGSAGAGKMPVSSVKKQYESNGYPKCGNRFLHRCVSPRTRQMARRLDVDSVKSEPRRESREGEMVRIRNRFKVLISTVLVAGLIVPVAYGLSRRTELPPVHSQFTILTAITTRTTNVFLPFDDSALLLFMGTGLLGLAGAARRVR